MPRERLIDVYLPEYDVSERHETRVHATRAATWAALRTTDLAASSIVRALLSARALPAALTRGIGGLRALWGRAADPIRLSAFEACGFRVLAETPLTELLIGLEGQFWRPSGRLDTPEADRFRTQPPRAGTARAVWNFELAEAIGGTTTLATETRVQCADEFARWRFLPYWYAIRPGSGLIRRFMLSAIRDTAETAERDASGLTPV